MTNALNENIKRLRIAHGMNQVVFGTRLGVTKQCVSNWENDNVLPSIEMLVKIADTFGVSTDYLLGRSERITLEVSSLTAEQTAHIALLVEDFSALNQKNGPSD